ncbi:MAG TPA: hypothetical protein O0Y05_01100 [Methanocorpusculum sp.]|nr:hypothetical protein [Methanocorpusculum sp.]
MNSSIEKVVVTGVAFYVLLMIFETICYPSVLLEATVGSVLLGILTSVFLSSREHAIHTGEMVLVWSMIMLFVLYGAFFWF